MDYIKKATLDEIARYGNSPGFNSNIDRRKFIRLAGEMGLAAVVAACGGKTLESPTSPTTPNPNPSPTPTPVPTPTPTPVYLQRQVPLEGLLYGTKGDGQVIFPGKSPLEFRNGVLTVKDTDQLVIGQTYRDVEIIPQSGVRRKTSVEVDENGLWSNIGYKIVPLDYIDDAAIAQKWAATRWEGRGLVRVDSRIGKLRVFFYDNSRWRLDDSGFVKTQDNVPVSQDTVDSVTSVVNNDLSVYTNGTMPNGGLIRESQSSLRPRYNEPGWLMYFVGETPFDWVISSSTNGTQNKGDTTWAHLLLNQNFSFSRRHGISIDTFEVLFQASNASYTPIDINSGFPNREVGLLAKIQYNRKRGNMGVGNIIDYQD